MKYDRNDLTEGLKKLVLAGIGAVSVTAEKAKEIIDELAKRGEITVEQGKALTEELKHNIENNKPTVEIKLHRTNTSPIEDVMEQVKDMSQEEIDELKQKLETYDADSADDDEGAEDGESEE